MLHVRVRFHFCISLALALAVCRPATSGFVSASAENLSELSLRQAIELALRMNPRVGAARQGVVARRGSLRSARSLPPPQLLATAVGTFNDNPLILSQSFDVIAKRDARSRSAHLETEAAAFRLQATQSEVEYDVAVAYAELQEAVELLKFVEQSTELLQSLRTIAQRRFDLGDVPRVHVTRTEIELDRVEQEMKRATAQSYVKRVALNAVMGCDPSTPVMPSDPLMLEAAPNWLAEFIGSLLGGPSRLASDSSFDLQRLRETAMAIRPQLQSARSLLRARQADVTVARAARFPDLVFQARTGTRIGSAGSQLGFGLSLPLFDWGSLSGEITSAKARAAEQAAVLSGAQLEASAEVESALHRLLAARSVAEGYVERIVPHTESLATTMRLSYEQGGSTLLEVIDAQRTLAAAQAERVRALTDYKTAVAGLRLAVGRKLADAKGGEHND